MSDWLLRRERALLLSLIFVGAVARVAACFLDAPQHPDEYFQYLEPAWWHLTGVGIEAWEWRDGIRSWVLPAFNGAWFAALRSVGVPSGPPLVLCLKVIWALINTLIVGVAYRGGKVVSRRLSYGKREALPEANLGVEGGLVAALLVATSPALVTFGSHTLSELPSMLCLVLGLVLTLELVATDVDPSTRDSLGKAFAVGALLSLGACLRIANAPLVLLSPAWLLVTGRFRALGALLSAAALVAAFFAAVDRVTWGGWAYSYVGYLKFNFVEGKASKFGTEPPLFYVTTIRDRLPFMLAPLSLIAVIGIRATWPLLFSALLSVAYLSTQEHKEERFIVAVWAFLLIAAGGVLGQWLRRAGTAHKKWPRAILAFGTTVVVALAALQVADGMLHLSDRPWPGRDRVEAEAWVSRQPDLTYLVIDDPISGGGAAWISDHAPHMSYVTGLLDNPLISHVITRRGIIVDHAAVKAGFTRVREVGELSIFARSPKSVAE